jgi:hypothetical protein
MSSSQQLIEVLKPTGRAKAVEGKPLAGVANLENKVIGFLDNRKPNFDLFVDKLETILSTQYRVAKIVRRRKPDPSGTAGVLLDELAQECDLVIAGSSD